MQTYFIKASITLLIVHLFYELVMRKNTPFIVNRFYLLLGFTAAFIVPLLRIPQAATPQVFYGYYIPELTMQNIAITVSNDQTFNISKVLFKIYLSGAIAMLLRVLVKFTSLLILYIKGEKKRMDSYRLVLFTKNLSPFTFFKVLFFPRDKHQVDQALINHELAHARGLHTLDNLFLELVSVVLWFHPSFWLMRVAAQQNHEFLADDAVLKKGTSVPDYQQLLLAYSLNSKQVLLGSSFNQSAMLTRMKMMITDKNKFKKNRKIISILFGAAIVSSAMVYNSCDASSQIEETLNAESIDVLSTDNKTVLKSASQSDIDAEIFFIVEEMPQFPSEDSTVNAFRNYVQKNLRYPEEAAKAGASGRVFVQFVVNSQGKVVNPVVARSVDNKYLDAEAIRVVSASPDWIPGKQRGRNVAVQFTIPIVFKMENLKQHNKDVFVIVEKMPKFKGGDLNNFRNYVNENIIYPKEAADAGIEDKVYVQFVVNNEGKVTDSKVVKSKGNKLLDNEAIRVINTSPLWTPGEQRGRYVAVQFTTPITFKIQ